MSEAGVLSLHERLVRVAAEIQVKREGKNAQGRATFSIEDIEKGIDELFVNHGILSDYSFNEPPTLYEQFGVSFRAAMWGVNIHHRIYNAENPSDRIEADLFDVGSSPSAAVSYALKRYFKAMFHVAEVADEARNAGAGMPENEPKQPKPLTNPKVQVVNKDGEINASSESSEATGGDAPATEQVPQGSAIPAPPSTGEGPSVEELVALAATLPAEAHWNEKKVRAMLGSPAFPASKVKAQLVAAQQKFGVAA